MRTINKKILIPAMAALLISISSCDKEFINPSAGSEPNVVGNVDGLMNLAAGLQRRFTIGRQSPLYSTVTGGGFSVFAFRVLNAGNTTEVELENGNTALTGANGVVANIWAQCLFTKNEAEKILSNLDVVGDPGDRLGLKAYASIFYALSLGTMAQYYEQVPLNIELSATFSPRADALKKAVETLEAVDVELQTGTVSDKFKSKVPAGIDLKNTVKALLARYYNMLAKLPGAAYDDAAGSKALAAANAVDLAVKSVFTFLESSNTINPVAEQILTVNVYGVADSALGLRNGLQPNAADGRLAFYLTRSTAYNPSTNVLTAKGFVSAKAAAFPVYLPGEMTLIKAEIYARKNDLANAKTELDKILTKTAAGDPFGIGANLPAYGGAMDQASILAEIYRQRRIELFMQGLELEDSRRFERAAPTTPPAPGDERNRTFYPYPNQERDNNTNTPPNPAI
jgi:starch-binding outer membrane protein, SusD/RagB family